MNAPLTMWTIAAAEFFLLKLFTLRGVWRDASIVRLLAYVAGWPGMNAADFLRVRDPAVPVPETSELLIASAKTVLGFALVAWAVRLVGTAPPLATAWVGMVGLIFALHFGCFHVLSWAWRRVGRAAPPIMRAPIVARSLAEFWGERWNLAFATAARRFLLRPLARRWGANVAGGVIFLVSGLVHETVVSLPAGGGWGGPTLYFILQAVGVGIEKHTPLRGRAWTLLVTALPLPLLFHAPFAENVIVPFFRFFKEVL